MSICVGVSSLGPLDPGLDLNQSGCVTSVLVYQSKRRVKEEYIEEDGNDKRGGLINNEAKILPVLCLSILGVMSYNNIVLSKLVMVCQGWL